MSLVFFSSLCVFSADASPIPSSFGKRKQNKGLFGQGKTTSVPGCHIQELRTFNKQRTKASRMLPPKDGTVVKQEDFPEDAGDAEASEGFGPLLWVVLWQCLSWLLCGVRTKQSASILPQKLVTFKGPFIHPVNPARAWREMRKDRCRVCACYQASLLIHSSNRECLLLFRLCCYKM